MFPVMLDLRGRRCLVVGGGGVALRKVELLLAEGAEVVVVAPRVVDAIEKMARRGEIVLERRSYRSPEAGEYALVFAATDRRDVNRRVHEQADRAGVWSNVADDPELCSFQLPARVQRGSLQLAVASGGEAPFAVRRMRQLLEERFGPEWGEWLVAAARFRSRVREAGMERPEQEGCFDRFFRATVDRDRLTVRVPTETEERIWTGAPTSGPPHSELRPPIVSSHRRSARRVGAVTLVGAGPGCAGLLTVRGRQRLLAADAVVYDRLATSALPCDLPARVELHCVGKTAGRHPVPQDRINDLLIRLAREGKGVVRLKGGDPYVFGRGGEEVEALTTAGIPFEVVPGITAGVAAPGWMGIPVTHRSESVRVTFLTAHECVKEEGTQVRWDLLAQDPHSTLVGYMGVKTLPRVVESLVSKGMDPATPAALVERATTAQQRSVVSTLAELPAAVRRCGLRPPALFIIGPTVRHAERLDWCGRLPLSGERLVLSSGATDLARTLEAAGAEVVEVPCPMTPAARVVIAAAPLTGCVLRSPAEAEWLDEEREAPGWEAGPVAWCLDSRTAARARELGWQHVRELDVVRDAAHLADQIGRWRHAA